MYEHDLKTLEGLQANSYGDSIKGHVKPIVHKTHEPYTVARIAMSMAERWGMVAAMPDGEDSAGRQKLRVLTPEELANKACATAAALWKEFGERDWFYENPMPIAVSKKEEDLA